MSDNWITFTVDGREVRAPEDELLLDAVKRGDVEVPFFCYEPKLGAPVGACRMCLVEIEGIPKLQTSCSTPVKDGMVVYTQTDRVKHAQNAVVEFLLVNHPLDCPVCDKGGECPLQDISFGWGPGRSRFQDQKRNFPKPIALSPLVAIDRERCILCYRCVRFSQEVAEDYQLVFLERADHTFVGTFDGHPYIAPFAGNIIELCPVGALTSTSYRFRARPWDIVDGGSICTLCPSQCNISFTVRDDRVERVLAARQRSGRRRLALRQGPLGVSVRERGRPRGRAARARRGQAAPDNLGPCPRGHGRGAPEGRRGIGCDRRRSDHERGGLCPPADLSRGARLRQRGLARKRRWTPMPRACWLIPDLGAAVSDIDGAACVLVLETDPINEAPIIDLRLRKAVRRFGCRLVVAASGPDRARRGRGGAPQLRAGHRRGVPARRSEGAAGSGRERCRGRQRPPPGARRSGSRRTRGGRRTGRDPA